MIARLFVVVVAMLCITASGCSPQKAVDIRVQHAHIRPPQGVDIALELVPRVTVTFIALSGTLTVDGKHTPYALTNLQTGDVLRRRTPHVVTVRVKPNLQQVGTGVLKGLFGQSLDVVFEGKATVRAWGKERTVPLRIERTVSP